MLSSYGSACLGLALALATPALSMPLASFSGSTRGLPLLLNTLCYTEIWKIHGQLRGSRHEKGAMIHEASRRSQNDSHERIPETFDVS